MGLVLAVLLWSLLAVLLLAAGVVLTPLHVRARLASAPPQARISVAPFGGMVPIPVFDSTRQGRRTKPEKARRRTEKADRRKKRRATRRERGGDGGFPFDRALPELPDLLQGLIAAVRFEHLRVDAAVGLDDPADTGALFGMLSPVVYGLGGGARVSLALAPDFDAPGLRGSADAALSVTLARLVPPAVRFGWRVFGPGR